MLILDTDHLIEFQKGTSPESLRLKQRLAESNENYSTTIVSVEEIMRGWMAAIRRASDPHTRIQPYQRLNQLFRFFAAWNVFDWSEQSANEFQMLKKAKIRVGTMDLMIASICIANDATLLSRNTRDFKQVPGLEVADWLA